MNFEKFRNPDSILRPAPFWAINDRITPEETARQMSDMIDKGLSGGFFHSRAGLITDYLGDEWFASMRAALEVAERQDGYLWLYDEDLWPSGNAGGQVAATKDEYREAFLQPELVPAGEMPLSEPDGELKAAYAIVERKGGAVHQIRQIRFDEAIRDRSCERLLFRRFYAGKTGWWSGESYCNLLHPEVTKRFIELTHEVYKKHLGSHFGQRIPGIFTDEPQLYSSAAGLPWYDGIPAAYTQRCGRDFWADLPFLFLDGGECRKIRLHAYRTIIGLFCAHYSKPIYDWCEANGIAHTGHYNAEDNFAGQLLNHCGGIAAHYRYQQLPGVDHLCRQTDPMLFTLKQTSSAARQLGRRGVLTEIFGVSHHTNTFEDFKWIGDYNLVLGATFFVPHLTWYSMRGKRKRDYPPNWNYQQTYWEHLRPLNDYFTRCAAVLTAGKPEVEVVFLHSIEDASASLRRTVNTGKRAIPQGIPAGPDLGRVNALDGILRRLFEAALNAGYDADLADEGYLEDYGKVEGKKLVIGQMAYSVVVVPEAQTWRPKTHELLAKFVEAGGKVILTGRLPQELDCMPAAEAWHTLSTTKGVTCIAASPAELQAALDKVAKLSYRLRSNVGRPVPHLYVQHRKDGTQDLFFIVNSERAGIRRLRLTVSGAAKKPVALWNPLDGTCEKLEAQVVGRDLVVELTLPAVGSAIVVVGKGAERAKAAPSRCACGGKILDLPTRWKHRRTQPNVLVLDRLSYSLDNGNSFSAEHAESRIRRHLAEHFGTRESLAWQPWVAVRKKLFDGKGGPVVLRYRFQSAAKRVRKAAVVIEDLHKGNLTVNGTPVETAGCGWHWDRGFGKADISNLVQPGENVIDFAIQYDFLSEIEQAYIVGDFGTRLRTPSEGELCAEPASLTNGSWIDQGYCFYPGSMVYQTTVRHTPKKGVRTFLRLKNPSGTLYVVRVNGAEAGRLYWMPLSLDLTPLLTRGENAIEIEVVSSGHNAHGPLHVREGDAYLWFGPNAFEDEHVLKSEFSLFDYGLLDGAELVVVKD